MELFVNLLGVGMQGGVGISREFLIELSPEKVLEIGYTGLHPYTHLRIIQSCSKPETMFGTPTFCPVLEWEFQLKCSDVIPLL